MKFWTDQVGFEVYENEKMTSEFSWIEVGPKDTTTHLVIYPKKLMKNWEELKTSLVFVCDNIEETCERMKENGVVFTSEPKTLPGGTFATFEDLEGNQFILKG